MFELLQRYLVSQKLLDKKRIRSENLKRTENLEKFCQKKNRQIGLKSALLPYHSNKL